MWRKLSAEDRKMYLNTAKKNKARKAVSCLAGIKL